MRKNPTVVNSSRPIVSVAMLRVGEIRRLREEMGLSKAEAARRAGFGSSQYWWNIENGLQPDIRLSTLAAIAKTLGCKLDDLYSTDDEPRRPRKPRRK